MINIRKVKIEDCKLINKLSNQLGYKSDIDETKNRLFTIVNSTEHSVYIAELENNVVGWIHGFISYRIESDTFTEIGGLVVDENHRRLGIGQLLVAKVLKWSKEKGVKRTRVRCNSKRIESHLFYENIGFDLYKEQKIFDKQL